MKLILLEDITKLGKAGEVVSVAPGYGRNYLLPKRFALLANQKTLKNLELIRKNAVEKSLKAQTLLKAKATELAGTEIHFLRKADENGHLYGSVSDTDIISSLKEKGFEIHKNMIGGDKHIKQIGSYDIQIHFNPEIQADIRVNVQNETD